MSKELEATTRIKREDRSQATLSALWEGGSLTRQVATQGSYVVGRGANVDVLLDHTSLSRRHAMIHLGDQLFVEDLGSANGTRVRGQAIAVGERVPVGWGEPIELGAAILMLRPPSSGDDRLAATAPHPTGGIVEGIKAVQRMVDLAAPTDMSVLLLGETGVGKGHFAHIIHAQSRRKNGPWLHLNCAALPENLLESELFGYERGAFTGATQSKPGLLESASGGTVFLDEVGDLPLGTQAKLLIALERREVMRIGALKPRPFDVRFISATNRALEEQSERGTFRADLYYRLAGLPITIPPLRERKDEIPVLAVAFLAESCKKLGRAEPALSTAALGGLVAFDWPGNVRQLATVLERALLWCGDVIQPEHLMLGIPSTGAQAPAAPMVWAPPPPRPKSVLPPPSSMQSTPPPAGEPTSVRYSRPPEAPASGPGSIPPGAIHPGSMAHPGAAGPTSVGSGSLGPGSLPPGSIPAPAPSQRSLREDVDAIERRRIAEALDACGGNQVRAAEMLGISRRTLINRMISYGMPRPRKG